jgi:hypothetical protein
LVSHIKERTQMIFEKRVLRGIFELKEGGRNRRLEKIA